MRNQKIDKNLEEALLKIEEDRIKIKLEQPRPDNYITIRTKKHEIRIGTNELGFWLDYIKEH